MYLSMMYFRALFEDQFRILGSLSSTGVRSCPYGNPNLWQHSVIDRRIVNWFKLLLIESWGAGVLLPVGWWIKRVLRVKAFVSEGSAPEHSVIH